MLSKGQFGFHLFFSAALWRLLSFFIFFPWRMSGDKVKPWLLDMYGDETSFGVHVPANYGACNVELTGLAILMQFSIL